MKEGKMFGVLWDLSFYWEEILSRKLHLSLVSNSIADVIGSSGTIWMFW